MTMRAFNRRLPGCFLYGLWNCFDAGPASWLQLPPPAPSPHPLTTYVRTCLLDTCANDVADAFGSSVAARTLTLRQALLIASVCEFSGSVLLGREVTRTVAGGIARLTAFDCAPELYMWVSGRPAPARALLQVRHAVCSDCLGRVAATGHLSQ
ncbi:hypothetical protein CHLRE_12g495953v5 [Chlamydomonas reinhardtii]|uniref:Uncharacterized protein n=1 Tax=Chlamydomonas reinhardtii TaxID=3055 RepID=A0A2K3D233_CHLRE|nr:uncharacterized protein CHLRE_12g495953v5 [Chlamydomonas reinhardtii]PNW74575.1 hypothetical protein CHLRE_12g495953v5 [Chlamydomonas reinhardtii]